MKTDIDKLHAVIQGEVSGRRCGRTFARCHELANTILVGEHNDILVEISSYYDLDYILPMLFDVLNEYKIPITSYRKHNNELTCNGKRIRFRVMNNEYDFTKNTAGIRSNYVPMRHKD